MLVRRRVLQALLAVVEQAGCVAAAPRGVTITRKYEHYMLLEMYLQLM